MMEAKWKATRILGLTCCLAFLTAVSMAQMDGSAQQTRTAVVKVQSADGTLIADAVVTYLGSGGEQLLATPQGDGSYLIPNAAEKLSLHIEHPSMRPTDLGVILTGLNSTVVVNVRGSVVDSKVLATPAPGGPSLGLATLGTAGAGDARRSASADIDPNKGPASWSNVAPPAPSLRTAPNGGIKSGGGDVCADYQIDDGSTETSVGFGTPAVVTWVNRFTVQAGQETIDAISAAFGSVPFGGNGDLVGKTFSVGVWSDPNQDSDPTDGALLSHASDVVAAGVPDTDTFQTVAIPPVVLTVGDFYFAIAWVQGDSFPSPLDTSEAANGRAWITGTIGGVFDPDVPDTGGGAWFDEDAIAPGIWLLRACSTGGGGGPGACCIGGDCVDGLTAGECAAAGGEFQGDGSECGGDGAVAVSFPDLPISSDLPPTVDTITMEIDLQIQDVDIDLVINHTWLGDLFITVEHLGTTVVLFDTCGNHDDMDVIFDDEGVPIACVSPVTGNITPISAGGGALSAFDNLSSAGDWTITIDDQAGGDDGTLLQWSVHVSGGGIDCGDGDPCGDGVCDDGGGGACDPSDCCSGGDGSPGCDCPSCEALVCGADAFCCDVGWDGLCEGAAADLCGDLCNVEGACCEGGTPGGLSDCCEGGDGSPGCDCQPCEDLVCGADAFCCDVGWDGLCEGLAAELCGDLCNGGEFEGCGAGGGGGGENCENCPQDCGVCNVCGDGEIGDDEECDGGLCPDGQECNENCTCPGPQICDGDETPENEPNCGIPVDTVNGGCNSSPPVYSPIECGQSYCGTAAFDGALRDTDWYELVLTEPTDVTWTVTATFDLLTFIIIPLPDCGLLDIGDAGLGGPGDTVVLTRLVPAGVVWLFAAPQFTNVFDCGAEYTATVTCEGAGCEDDADCDAGEICGPEGLCIPANDFCEDAIALAVPSLTSGSTDGATFDGTPFCGTNQSAPGVWYSVTGTGNTMTASTCNMANYDTKITIFCGDCPEGGGSDCCGGGDGSPGCDDPECQAIVCGIDAFCCDVGWDGICDGIANDNCEICMGEGGLTCVDGLDDTAGCAGFTTELSWCSQEGAEYLILIHGFGAATGDFDLELTDDGADCSGAVQCVATGACCFGVDCVENLPEAICVGQGGEWQGEGSACNEAGETFVLTSTPNLPIISNGDPAVDTIMMGMDFQVQDVDIDLVINHTWIGDLFITVEYAGTTVVLWDAACGSNDNMDVIFDDEGGAVNCASPTTGNITPASAGGDALSAFDGGNSAGAWTITVSDQVGGDDGTLVSWSIHLTEAGASICGCGGPEDCSDGDPCTQDVCGEDGECSNPPVDCGDLDDDCNVGVCVDGTCVAEPANGGGACGSSSDTDCDNPNTCSGGVCQENYEDAGTGCTDDGNVCTDDECDGSGNCTHPNNTEPCNDGNPCTTEDTCSDGACEGGPPLDCDDNDSCTADSCDPATGCVNQDIEQTLIIKQGACPNPVNPNSNGVVQMLLVGDDDFNVNNIDLASLELRRCDGVGGSATPLEEHTQVKDLNHPSDSVACGGCACNANQSSDGVDDLSLKFRTSTTLAALELGVGAGVVTLELTGELNDGTPFCSRDCVIIVPPGTGSSNLSMEASVFDTFIEVEPWDLNVDGDGFSNFSRAYIEGTEVTINAPMMANGRRFLRWIVDGVTQPFGLRSIQVTATANDIALMAIFERPGRLVPDRPEEGDGDLE